MTNKSLFARILGRREHYGASGVNAHIVLRASYADPMPSDFNAMKLTTIALRRGRDDEGEAVQIEITVETVGSKRSTRKDSTVSMDQETWDAVIEFVRESRTVTL